MLANAHLEALFGKRLGELGRLLHAGEAFGRVDVEGIGIDRLAVVHRVADGLEEAELEPVASLYADAEIGKDEEALMRAVDVFEVV
jgi:hypothetical protein